MKKRVETAQLLREFKQMGENPQSGEHMRKTPADPRQLPSPGASGVQKQLAGNASA